MAQVEGSGTAPVRCTALIVSGPPCAFAKVAPTVKISLPALLLRVVEQLELLGGRKPDKQSRNHPVLRQPGLTSDRKLLCVVQGELRSRCKHSA